MPMLPLSRSQYEDNYARALISYKIEIRQQVPLGVYGLRGSQIIDIVAYVPPRKAAIFIQGGYWHGPKQAEEDSLKKAAAEHLGYRVIEVHDHDAETYEAARAHVLATFF